MNKTNPKSFSDLLFGETELKTQEQINESGLSRVWSHTENHDCGYDFGLSWRQIRRTK